MLTPIKKRLFDNLDLTLPPEARRRSEGLTQIAFYYNVILLFFTIAMKFAPAMGANENPATFMIMSACISINAISYFFSRTKHYALAAGLFCLSMLGGVTFGIMGNPTPFTFHVAIPFLGIALALLSYVATLKIHFLFFLLSLAVCVASVFFYPNLTITEGITGGFYLGLAYIVSFLGLRLKNADFEHLKQERASLYQASKLSALGEMAAGVAHEINNPLSVIAGSIDLIEKNSVSLTPDPEKSEKVVSRIAMIRKAVNKIEKIVNGLRTYTRRASESPHTEMCLAQIVEEAILLTQAKRNQHQVKLHANLNSRASIICDEVEIEQVLVNLINNAVDAIKAQAAPWIQISLNCVAKPENQLLLEITDSGPGIPLDIQEKLFQPFFTTKPVGEGTGLGLSISKGILDRHGAEFRIDNQSKNTCFQIVFNKAKSEVAS